jgi:hypothetical protein
LQRNNNRLNSCLSLFLHVMYHKYLIFINPKRMKVVNQSIFLASLGGIFLNLSTFLSIFGRYSR